MAALTRRVASRRFSADAASIERHALRSAILCFESLIAHREINNSLDESDQRGNEGPAKYQIKYSLAYAAQIKFMNSDAPQQDGK
jgi:hypothetical protein